ncbi:ThiF family adenylyltransferase [Actinokineospora sp. NBRC 105648]|uniref:HesA/MoeB/ThiF family protein n=1 Tax=Actinokineospora sp. NBRC 105648 TaxID=3032206 RepID=UPI0024A160D6|nr:ThiF family adenylyltransferase [Actinokineospora sp. NBRC 105648]GLZ40784.1 hypothetical protein Acsp05_44080 [Actinokineospora sp. NBRC 105648]
MSAHVVFEAAVVRMVAAGAVDRARVTEVDGGEVLRVHAAPGDGAVVLRTTPDEPVAGARVHCVVDGADVVCLDESLRPLPVTVIPEHADVFDRVRGVFETDILRDRAVAVLGLGSGGSVVVRELARSGVGRFLLVDHDRLEVGNVCRHECGLADVGRLKTNAVRELILDRNPDAEVTTLDLRISSETVDELTAAIKAAGVDVVVCATDNRESRLLVNRLCVLAGLPALFAGVFRRAYGGQVLRYLPGLTPCYQCFVSAVPAMANDREIASAEQAHRIAYSDRPVAVEPGLAADIAPIALMMAKLTTQELLAGTATTLASLNEDLVAPLYLWLNRREAETDYAALPPMATGVDTMSVLRWYGIDLPRDIHCPACGTPAVEGVEPTADLDTSDFRA